MPWLLCCSFAVSRLIELAEEIIQPRCAGITCAAPVGATPQAHQQTNTFASGWPLLTSVRTFVQSAVVHYGTKVYGDKTSSGRRYVDTLCSERYPELAPRPPKSGPVKKW